MRTAWNWAIDWVWRDSHPYRFVVIHFCGPLQLRVPGYQEGAD